LFAYQYYKKDLLSNLLGDSQVLTGRGRSLLFPQRRRPRLALKRKKLRTSQQERDRILKSKLDELERDIRIMQAPALAPASSIECLNL
jgi:hypothetical protein